MFRGAINETFFSVFDKPLHHTKEGFISTPIRSEQSFPLQIFKSNGGYFS
jgi:hypothetical protein